MLIYKVTNIINGKEYVGQTICSLEKRKAGHIYEALNTKDYGHFHRAIRKYGQNNFKWEILTRCSDIKELNRLETHYITLYDTFENGYNLTLGGYNTHFSEETKKKISVAASGRKHSEETKRKLSIINKGKKLSDETKRRMSVANSGRKHSEFTCRKIAESLRGGVCSEKTRRKISEANKGKKHSKDSKIKMSIIKKGKSRIATRAVIVHNKYFDTIKGAAEWLGVVPKTISDRIKRQSKGYRYI